MKSIPPQKNRKIKCYGGRESKSHSEMSISENKFLASLTGEKKYSRCLVAPFNEKITKRNGKYKS